MAASLITTRNGEFESPYCDMQYVKTASSDQRVNSDPLTINDDWPGLFLRGDDALGRLSPILHWASENNVPGLIKTDINRFFDLLDKVGVINK